MYRDWGAASFPWVVLLVFESTCPIAWAQSVQPPGPADEVASALQEASKIRSQLAEGMNAAFEDYLTRKSLADELDTFRDDPQAASARAEYVKRYRSALARAIEKAGSVADQKSRKELNRGIQNEVIQAGLMPQWKNVLYLGGTFFVRHPHFSNDEIVDFGKSAGMSLEELNAVHQIANVKASNERWAAEGAEMETDAEARSAIASIQVEMLRSKEALGAIRSSPLYPALRDIHNSWVTQLSARAILSTEGLNEHLPIGGGHHVMHEAPLEPPVAKVAESRSSNPACEAPGPSAPLLLTADEVMEIVEIGKREGMTKRQIEAMLKVKKGRACASARIDTPTVAERRNSNKQEQTVRMKVQGSSGGDVGKRAAGSH